LELDSIRVMATRKTARCWRSRRGTGLTGHTYPGNSPRGASKRKLPEGGVHSVHLHEQRRPWPDARDCLSLPTCPNYGTVLKGTSLFQLNPHLRSEKDVAANPSSSSSTTSLLLRDRHFLLHEFGRETLAALKSRRHISGSSPVHLADELQRIPPPFGEEPRPAPEREGALMKADTPEKLQEWWRRFGIWRASALKTCRFRRMTPIANSAKARNRRHRMATRQVYPAFSTHDT
jgi:hypothetical protein